MFVYTTSFENINAYSTARKAIESICYGTIDTNQYDYDYNTHESTHVFKGRKIDMSIKTESDIKHLIKVLNNYYLLAIDTGNNDTTYIEKIEIR